ncbi:hypothetical protein BDV32DRAFT_119032 [Aspergillus pseudonomiae]|uniref:Uncharacterized protein n=1 Tax=Aspergillus pseudonomiae TaxID=1506151 RepID=A0A5N6ICB2_9EURO|nr:uncharacterized protein BDV37DRAFT_296030 [Aspergillus pseudonomiae]KAB8263707.1 hypothetical protein BDV32DRAFT_119032 [Aspergillus pseudonomiae]KAE8408573.1 hypothetical protein BDV37DRAFT_296030 [Aspergillus pseudonomiae]
MLFWMTATAVLALLLTTSAKSPTGTCDATMNEATEFSLIYGYPLIAYSQLALPIVSEHGTNSLQHQRQLANPERKSVVRPNVDTLYSHSILDISHEDLVFEIPNITDRYWVCPFYDVYGNNYANLGSITKSPPGKYRVRYAFGVGEEPGITYCGGKSERPECDGYQGLINAPTPYGAVDARILVRQNDLEMVHTFQNHTLLYTVPRVGQAKPYAPKLTTTMLNASLARDLPMRIMQMTARFTPHNPPRNISDVSRVDTMLLKAGIHDGYSKPVGANLTHMAQMAEAAVSAHAYLPKNIRDLKKGWLGLAPSAQGDYNLDYKMRSFLARYGYLALDATEALYPTYHDPKKENFALTLEPKEAYMITFVGKPPLTKQGFWSITVYKEQYLVANPLKRYALGDRSNLTYADGAPVYGTDSKNASFQILLQPADIEPPKNWTSNWLPAPPGGGEISISLRFYGPAQALIGGEWAFPEVKKHAAFEG